MKVVLGVSGSIAAFKAVEVMREIQKSGGKVKVVMTESAEKFVSPLTFETLSGHKVLTGMFHFDDPLAHITFAKWSDVLLIAPATANTLSKIALGIADNALTAVALALPPDRRKVVVPAMNTYMYLSPQVQRSIKLLRRFGWQIVKPVSGKLACGDVGKGKFPPVNTVVAFAMRRHEIPNLKVLVTAGGTREYIDPVRFIGNASSGRTGVEIGKEFWLRGADVELVYSNVSVDIPDYIRSVRAETSDELYYVLSSKIDDFDILVMAAAVSDFKPKSFSKEKLKRESKPLNITLSPTRDVMASISTNKRSNQLSVAFALETSPNLKAVIDKAHRKKADIVVLNRITEDFSPIGGAETRVEIYDVSKETMRTFEGNKREAAKVIVDEIVTKLRDLGLVKVRTQKTP